MNENEFSDEEDEVLEEDELGENVSAFAVLESEYKSVLSKLQENEELNTYAEHFSKLFEAYSQSYNSEQNQTDKCNGLENQILELKEESDKLKKRVENDTELILNLKEELGIVKKLNDNANTREKLQHERIESMSSQILELREELELRIAMASDVDDETGASSKLRESIEKEKQMMTEEIANTNKKLEEALKRIEEFESKKSTADTKIKELNTTIEQNISEIAKKQRKIDELERELATVEFEIQKQHFEIQDACETVEADKKRLEELDIQCKLQKTVTEKLSKDEKLIKSKLEKCQHENNILNEGLLSLKQKYSEESILFKMKEEECMRLKNEMVKISKQRDNFENKVAALERSKINIEQERDKYRNNVDFLEKEIIITKKRMENDKRSIENLVREKEILHKSVMRVQNYVDEHVKMIKGHELEKRKIEAELNELRSIISKQKLDIVKIDKERNKALEEIRTLAQQVDQASAECKLKQQVIYDLKKNISDLEAKCREQQNLFDTVRADRNIYQKGMQETSAEVNELKSLLKIAHHQIEQLKSDVAGKEMVLLREENILKKINKEKENLKVEVQTGLNNLQKVKFELQEASQNEKSYLKFIHENEAIIRKQAKDLEQITMERDIISADLVRKKHEISLLNEKIKILQTTLNRGEMQYEQRLEDIRLLKLEIQTLRQEKKLLSNQISSMTDVKQENFALERELAQERLKCRALEEELQTPLNIHRWRKLESSDPDAFELLKKIHYLQKKIVNQSREAIVKEEELKESEKLFFNMRQVLARQPGPQVVNELTKAHKKIAAQNKKIKCLTSEVNMYETQTLECKAHVEKLKEELKTLKKDYYKQKKINQAHLVASTKLPTISSSESQVKFAGGGYKM